MTQGANFKHADWSISSISQSRGWGSFSLPVSLLFLLTALSSNLLSFFLFILFFPPLSFTLGQIRAGCCPPCQDPCVWIQSPRVKIEAISFPGGREKMHTYYLTERTRAMDVNRACFMKRYCLKTPFCFSCKGWHTGWIALGMKCVI